MTTPHDDDTPGAGADELTLEDGSPFDTLEAQAAALEGAHAGQAEARAQAAQQAASKAAEVQVASIASELEGALQMVRMMAAPLMAWWPAYESTWSDATLKAIATSGAAIMQRHGWTMGEAWAHLGPYIALIGATLPPALMTWQAVKQRQALERQAARTLHHPAPVAPVGEPAEATA